MTPVSGSVAATSACPFCLAQKPEDAPICPACNRDTAVPATLLEERDELLRHRNVLRTELEAKTKRLATKMTFRRAGSRAMK